MTNKKTTEVVAEIVELLTPLPVEERTRAIKASLVLLGEPVADRQLPGVSVASSVDGNDDELPGISPRALIWMKQNGISQQELQQVFHVENGNADVIAEIPGKNKREKTYNAYVLIGLTNLLATGSPTFEDKAARALCETAGCYDKANHSVTIKEKGNEFTGTKDKGWSLTAPGLKRAAVLVKEMTKG